MKILDSTSIIAILSEINCPEIIDKILGLNHTLIIPSFVYDEMLTPELKISCDRMISNGKMHISTINDINDIKDLQKTYPFLGKGELDSMLQYDKLRNTEPVYCIFDDRRARTVASERGILYTGLLGLLCMIKNREIIDDHEYEEIISALRNSSFRMPNGFC